MALDIAEELFPGTKKRVENGKCGFCGDEAGEFRDELSKKEHKISGMCQDCQDKVFGH